VPCKQTCYHPENAQKCFSGLGSAPNPLAGFWEGEESGQRKGWGRGTGRRGVWVSKGRGRVEDGWKGRRGKGRTKAEDREGKGRKAGPSKILATTAVHLTVPSDQSVCVYDM